MNLTSDVYKSITQHLKHNIAFVILSDWVLSNPYHDYLTNHGVANAKDQKYLLQFEPQKCAWFHILNWYFSHALALLDPTCSQLSHFNWDNQLISYAALSPPSLHPFSSLTHPSPTKKSKCSTQTRWISIMMWDPICFDLPEWKSSLVTCENFSTVRISPLHPAQSQTLLVDK